MNGFLAGDMAGVVGTWVAAVATVVVLGGLLGERRVFGWSQHLLAGLATGLLAVLAVSEVIGPRLVEPLATGGAARGELWLGLALVAAAAGSPWLPGVLAGVPISVAIGALAAFALGGAVIGTLLPQFLAAISMDRSALVPTIAGLAGAAVTATVALSFVHGVPRGRAGAAAFATGRWLLLAGIGAWLGYVLVSRLVLLLDRLAFLLGDWLGIGA